MVERIEKIEKSLYGSAVSRNISTTTQQENLERAGPAATTTIDLSRAAQAASAPAPTPTTTTGREPFTTGDPNVKCPGELNTVIVTVLSNSLLDSNGLYAGVNPLNLANCSEVEKLKQQLIKDGFLFETESGTSFSDPSTIPNSNVVIEDVKSYDVSRLRLSTNPDLYVSDPVAYITNRVWNYDLENINNIEFGYRMPNSVDVNAKTEDFILGCFGDQNINTIKNGVLAIKKLLANVPVPLKSSVRKVVQYTLKQYDLAFKIKFAFFVKQYLFKQFPQSNLTSLDLADDMYLWIWINQIFAKNVELKLNNLFDFNVGGDNCIPLNFAAYFLSQEIDRDLNLDFFNFYKDVANKIDSAKTDGFPFELQVEKLVAGKTFVNKNNYLKNNKSVVQSSPIVNYPDSPFFTYNQDNFNKGDKGKLPTAKQIKKCKDDKINKRETGLRLFYKEGNDNILDKDVPPAGLGCETNTLAWPTARNILFDGDSIDTVQQRVNLSLPYYNSLSVSYKNDIPEELDVYKFLQKNSARAGSGLSPKDADIFKGFNTLLITSKLIDASDILIDKNLTTLRNGTAANALFSKYSNSDPSWGLRKFIQELPKSGVQELLFSKAPLYPFLGFYNVGFAIDKKSLNNTLQRFWINPIVFLPNSNENFDNLFRIYDSQLKYAKSYSYALRQFTFANEVEYQYSSISSFSLDSAEATRYSYTPIFKETKFVGEIETINLNEVDAGISFVDLPPNDLFLQVYPRRGVNDELLFLFNRYSTEGKVQEKIIPKKFWPEDGSWQEAKDYYLKGINQPSLSENQALFADVPIRKIRLYGTKEKPKNQYEIKNLISEIDVLQEGFYKELKIEPNVKYYFSATAISATGLESPPSQVYSVELVDDAGAVFPLIQVLEFKDERVRKEKQSFSSKFRIEPALLQQAPNPPKNSIGYLDPSVFSTKKESRPQFKVRLTSKKTGKKADFNLIYKQNFVTNGTDEGPLNLNVVTKDKVLISYSTSETEFGKEAAEVVATEIVEGRALSPQTEKLIQDTVKLATDFNTVSLESLLANINSEEE
jgi:hypothetical protein